MLRIRFIIIMQLVDGKAGRPTNHYRTWCFIHLCDVYAHQLRAICGLLSIQLVVAVPNPHSHFPFHLCGQCSICYLNRMIKVERKCRSRFGKKTETVKKKKKREARENISSCFSLFLCLSRDCAFAILFVAIWKCFVLYCANDCKLITCVEYACAVCVQRMQFGNEYKW